MTLVSIHSHSKVSTTLHLLRKINPQGTQRGKRDLANQCKIQSQAEEAHQTVEEKGSEKERAVVLPC